MEVGTKSARSEDELCCEMFLAVGGGTFNERDHVDGHFRPMMPRIHAIENANGSVLVLPLQQHVSRLVIYL